MYESIGHVHILNDPSRIWIVAYHQCYLPSVGVPLRLPSVQNPILKLKRSFVSLEILLPLLLPPHTSDQKRIRNTYHCLV